MLKPEFLNRLDDLIVFHSLGKPELLQIVDLEIKKVVDRIKSKDITLVARRQGEGFPHREGLRPAYGARPMRRAVERYLEDPLAEEILRGNIKPGDTAQVSAENGKLTFSVPEVNEAAAGAS